MGVEKDAKIIDMISLYVQRLGAELVFAERVTDSDNPDMWVIKLRRKNGQEVSWRVPLSELGIRPKFAKEFPSILSGILDLVATYQAGKKRNSGWE